jgi:hypothetical protein
MTLSTSLGPVLFSAGLLMSMLHDVPFALHMFCTSSICQVGEMDVADKKQCKRSIIFLYGQLVSKL